MPIANITVTKGRPLEDTQAMMKAVTDAIESTLHAPRESIRVIVREVEPQLFSVGGVPKSADS